LRRIRASAKRLLPGLNHPAAGFRRARMKVTPMTQKTNQNPWTMDVRVRERNLKSGSLTDKDVEKYLGGLPDVGDQAESFGTAQPALAQPVHAQPSVGVVDDGGVDDDDDDDDDDNEPEASSNELNGEGTP
jgi:hypothetical protein